MDIKEHIDPIAAIEGLVSELFQKAFQNEGLRQHLSFAQISQGSTASGLPRWYLWLGDREGAFSLTIEEGHVESSNAAAMPGHTLEAPAPVSARIIVRYFPDINEEVFDSLSCFEQIARLSPAFDATGTPTFEGAREMDHSFFVAGQIDVDMYASPSAVDFFCSAPERWRDYRRDGLTLVDGDGESQQLLQPGEIDRDFPGWEPVLHVFQKVVSSFCSLTGQTPHWTGFSTQPSMHFEIDADQTVAAVPDAGINDCRLGVSFHDLPDAAGGAERKQVFKARLSPVEDRVHGVWERGEDLPPSLMCPDWWTISEAHCHGCSDHLCSCYRG